MVMWCFQSHRIAQKGMKQWLAGIFLVKKEAPNIHVQYLRTALTWPKAVINIDSVYVLTEVCAEEWLVMTFVSINNGICYVENVVVAARGPDYSAVASFTCLPTAHTHIRRCSVRNTWPETKTFIRTDCALTLQGTVYYQTKGTS